MKKITSILFCLVVVIAFSASAFAASKSEKPTNIIVTNSHSKIAKNASKNDSNKSSNELKSNTLRLNIAMAKCSGMPNKRGLLACIVAILNFLSDGQAAMDRCGAFVTSACTNALQVFGASIETMNYECDFSFGDVLAVLGKEPKTRKISPRPSDFGQSRLSKSRLVNLIET